MGAPLHVGIVLATVAGAIYAFAREKLPPDVTALLVLLVLVISGVLTPAEGFAGFSHPATISVAAVLVLSASLERSGVFNVIARRLLSHLGNSEILFGIVLMLMVGVLSAFINNTAAVAIFLPIVMQTCRRTGARPGRLLIPMSFAAMFGGLSTLIGTSTNIVVHEYARSEGLRGFSMFEFARIGLPLFALGFVYLLVVGRWLLPRGEPVDSPEDRFGLSQYTVDLFVHAGSSWVGRQADPVRLRRDHDVDLVGVRRGGAALRRDPPWPKLMAGDRLRVHGPVQDVMTLASREGLRLAHPENGHSAEAQAEALVAGNGGARETQVLAEVVLLPASPAVGHTLETARFRGVYAATILGMRRGGHQPPGIPAREILHAGDALLLQIAESELEALSGDPGVLVMSATPTPETRPGRLALSLLTLAGVVLTAAVGLLPIVTAASAGCLLLMVTGALRPREAYESINWQVVFMLAGVLALGNAMEKTGIAATLATWITALSHDLGPTLAISVMYLITAVLTQFMTNNAAAALLVPVALDSAELLEVNPAPFLIAVTVAASTAFGTPVGYQTNLMVYGPGGYRFSDFVRVGLPLSVLFWVFVTLAIPRLWPLTG
jgi:di/tricarboxylate transporter